VHAVGTRADPDAIKELIEDGLDVNEVDAVSALSGITCALPQNATLYDAGWLEHAALGSAAGQH